VPTSGVDTTLSLSGRTLTWAKPNFEYQGFPFDVFAYDFKAAREVRLTSSPVMQWMPAVSEPFVVWEDHRDANAEIYIEDLRKVFYPGL